MAGFAKVRRSFGGTSWLTMSGKPRDTRGIAVEFPILYSWPGNIRQLSNIIRVALALLDDDETVITEGHLPEELFELAGNLSGPAAKTAEAMPWIPDGSAAGGSRSLEEIGRQAALRALETAGGNVSAAARQLGISRNTLYRKLGRL